jgi:hypothetical protein
MTNQHPITPSPEQVDQWFDDAVQLNSTPKYYIARQAALWSADQELEACCAEVLYFEGKASAKQIREARRPKKLTLPLTLKDQALALLEIDHGLHAEDLSLLRRALEQLPND